jgi:nickel-dependent lactate racemase
MSIAADGPKRLTRVELPYGSGTLEIEVPTRNLLAVVEPREVDPPADVESLITEALRNPIGSPPPSDLLHGGERLLVIVDDLTRPTPVHLILPPLLEELEVERKHVQVTILIALGTHRKMTPAEIERKVGKEIVRRWPVLNHEWDVEDCLVDLGVTPNGTPIKVNRLVQEHDVVVGISNIVPHNLAGWSGGAKIIQPGICGKETTYRTHLLAARCTTTNFGKLDNPVRAEIEEVVRRVRLDLSVNIVLNRQGNLVHVVAGEAQPSHRRAVGLARAIWQVPVPSLADIVIVSSHPADIDFWQANKGLHAAEPVIKRGGDIILLTPCPEGLSSEREHVVALEALQGISTRNLYHEARRRGVEDYAALCVSVVAARCNETGWVTVVSEGLTDHDLQVLGFGRAASVDEALGAAFQRQGEDASLVVITHGGETFASIE